MIKFNKKTYNKSWNCKKTKRSKNKTRFNISNLKNIDPTL